VVVLTTRPGHVRLDAYGHAATPGLRRPRTQRALLEDRTQLPVSVDHERKPFKRPLEPLLQQQRLMVW
jgi:hypothetical protein